MAESTGKVKGSFAEHKDALLGAGVICGVVGIVAGVLVSFIGGIGWALGSGVAIFLLLGSVVAYAILADLHGPQTEGDVDEEGYRHGCWIWKNDDDQLLREDNYVHGVKDGPQVRWHENGNKQEEIRYRNGKLHGTWTIWYDNDNKAEEETYDDGRMKGEHIEWYGNGQKKKECYYHDNAMLHGDWAAWHENGTKRIESHFEFGTPVGTWTEWNSEGNVISQREFTAGVQQGTGLAYFSDVSNPQTTRGNVLFLIIALLLLAFGTYQQNQFASIVVVFFVVVFIHESGHFIAARFLGIPISHFVLGIGPRLFGFHIGHTAFELRVIPLMGYVKEYDLRQKELEHFRRTGHAANIEPPYPEIDASEPRRGSSQLVSRPRRLVYLFGGIVLNIATVWLIAFAGWRQKHPENDFVETLQGSLNVMGELILVAGTMAGLALNVGDSNGFVEGLNILTETGVIIGFIGLLSMYVACLNLLPIPPLDGFQILQTTIELAIRREINERYVLPLKIAGACLVVAMLTLTALHFSGGVVTSIRRGLQEWHTPLIVGQPESVHLLDGPSRVSFNQEEREVPSTHDVRLLTLTLNVAGEKTLLTDEYVVVATGTGNKYRPVGVLFGKPAAKSVFTDGRETKRVELSHATGSRIVHAIAIDSSGTDQVAAHSLADPYVTLLYEVSNEEKSFELRYDDTAYALKLTQLTKPD